MQYTGGSICCSQATQQTPSLRVKCTLSLRVMHDMQFFMAGSVSCQQSGIYNIFKKKKNNWERRLTCTSCSSFSSFSCSSTKYLEVTRPFWDLSRQSLASSSSWCWMKPSTPSARGRALPGEHSAMMSRSRPSICAVACKNKQDGRLHLKQWQWLCVSYYGKSLWWVSKDFDFAVGT